MLDGMAHLRLVTDDDCADAAGAGGSVPDGRPRVSLRLLMAASGRCSCDACVLAYRAGDKRAGIIDVRAATRLHAAR
jgi:hypothetical protein